LSPEQAQASWSRAFVRAGSDATIVRDGVSYACRIKPISMALASMEQVMRQDMRQTRRRFMILNDGIGGIPLPLKPSQDRLVIGGRTMVIMIVDDQSHKIDNTLLGIQVEVTGA